MVLLPLLLLLLLPLLGDRGAAQRTPVLESVTNYQQCTTSGGDDGPPDLAGLNCTNNVGFTSFNVNLSPSSGGGDLFLIRTSDTQFQSFAPDNQQYEEVLVNIQASAISVYYRLDLLLLIPTRYAVQQVLLSTCPCCGACTGRSEQQTTCTGATGPFPAFDPTTVSFTPPFRVAAVNASEMYRGSVDGDDQCYSLFCAVCVIEAGAAPSRRSCQHERWIWIYPLWRVYTIQPYPIVEYSITVTLTRTSDLAQETLTLRPFGLPNGTESQFVAFSANNLVRVELLDQSSFDTIPAQLGMIIAAERHPLATPSAGNAIVDCDPATQFCPPYAAYEEGAVNPRVARAGQVSPVPEWWFWGVNGENQLFVGPECNQYGVTPALIPRGRTTHVDAPMTATSNGVPTDSYPLQANAMSMCHSFQTTCVPGYDFWSNLGEFAQPPTFFAQQNLKFCAPDPATRRCTNPIAPPYMPAPSTSNNAVPNVHLTGDKLVVDVADNLGFSSQIQVRVSGTFLRRVRILGTGYLRHIDLNACSLVLGTDGTMQVDVCSSTPVAADFNVVLNCSAAGPAYNVFVPSATVTVLPKQCQTVALRLRLTGSTIVPEGRECVLTLFDTNTTEPRLLDTLTEGCRESLPTIVPPNQSTNTGGGTTSTVQCDWYNLPCFVGIAIPNWFAMLLTALLPLLILAIIIGLAVCCGGPMLSALARSSLAQR